MEDYGKTKVDLGSTSVDVVDVVVEVDESFDFFQPRIINNGSETTSIILSNLIFPSSGNC